MKITTARTLARIFWYTVSGLAILLTLTCGGSMYLCAATGGGFIEGGHWGLLDEIQSARRFDKTPPQWSPDGRLIVFSHNGAVYAVESDGSGMRRLTFEEDPKWIWNFDDGLEAAQSPSISPDGSRIAYAAFRHDRWWLPEIEDYQWDIVTSKIDGSGRRRITRNGRSFSPAWSPDGTRIAFVSRGKLYTVAPDGSTIRSLAPDLPARHDTPVWSPDGRRLAFVVAEPASPDEKYPSYYSKNALYTMEADGSGLTRLGETGGSPSWSPDGGRIAFARINGDTQAVVTMDPDGSNLRTVLDHREHHRYLLTAGLGDVSWSPDGKRILFVGLVGHAPPYLGGSVNIVNADGSDARQLTSSDSVSWSPDGSRIAYTASSALATMSPDAMAERDSVGYSPAQRNWRLSDERRRRLRAVEARTSMSTTPVAVFSPKPKEDQGLQGPTRPAPDGSPSGDRAALAALYDAADGPRWRYSTNWLSDEPLDTWYGVTTDVSGRVTRLDLSDNGLNGEIPAELARLSSLRALFLGGNRLRGHIPPELGTLPDLVWLGLGFNQLSGHIPPELGGLPYLKWLLLYGNELTGSIPAELGGWSNLEWLDLGLNRLSGKIPAELGNAYGLRELNLDGNRLSGEIPRELGNLRGVPRVNLRDNAGLCAPSDVPLYSWLVGVPSCVPLSQPPAFADAGATRSVAENTPPRRDVGSAVTAFDPDDDTLTYSPSGADAESFGVDSSTGQIVTSAALDYETKSSYLVTVRVTDGKPDSSIDDSINVVIRITNVDEPGNVRLSSRRPRVGDTVTATLVDSDGGVTNESWRWQRWDGDTWIAIADATGTSYTVTGDDVGNRLRATVSYDDGHGEGKSLESPASTVVTISSPGSQSRQACAGRSDASCAPRDVSGFGLYSAAGTGLSGQWVLTAPSETARSPG